MKYWAAQFVQSSWKCLAASHPEGSFYHEHGLQLSCLFGCETIQPWDTERNLPYTEGVKAGLVFKFEFEFLQGDKNAGNTCIVTLYPRKLWNVFQGQRDASWRSTVPPPQSKENRVRGQSQSTRSVSSNPAWDTCSKVLGEQLPVASWLSDKWHQGPFLPLLFSLSPESWEAGEKSTWGSGGSGVEQLN